VIFQTKDSFNSKQYYDLLDHLDLEINTIFVIFAIFDLSDREIETIYL